MIKRPKIANASYHHNGKKPDYRNIAIPNSLHKRVSHIAIELEISISEISTALIEEFCARYENGSFGDLNSENIRSEDEET